MVSFAEASLFSSSAVPVYTGWQYSKEGECICTMNSARQSLLTKCLCFEIVYTPDVYTSWREYTPEMSPFIFHCDLPQEANPKRPDHLPDHIPYPLSASESEEGDRPKPQHAQDAAAPAESVEGQRVRRETPLEKPCLKTYTESNETECWKPHWCDCKCKLAFGKYEPGKPFYECICGDWPEWYCRVHEPVVAQTNVQKSTSSVSFSI